jgi:hypothetical protein
MKQLSLFLLLVGFVLLLMGYLEIYFNSQKREKKIEYRFIPRNVYDQIQSNDLEDQFSYMFDATDLRNTNNLI